MDLGPWFTASYSSECADRSASREDVLVAALAELVTLKDGPRDCHYYQVRDGAWARARAALASLHPREGKLVRDRIPEIIQQAGLIPVIETAPPEDYGRYVRAKLVEELGEYLSSGDVAELADLVEACFAAAALHGVGQDELLAIALDKRQQRGSFDNRLVWMGNLPGGPPDA